MKTRILLADDEQSLRFLIAETLEDEGFDITEADDGDKAIRLLEQISFDLLILDYMMPEKTGIEVIEWVRSSSGANRDTPIILLTAKSMEQDKIRAKEAGATLYIVKPFPPHQLAEAVRQLIVKQQREQQDNTNTGNAQAHPRPGQPNVQRERKSYLQSCQQQIDQLAKLIKLPNIDLSDNGGIYRIAHTLKGSAATFGFDRISSLADELLALCRSTAHNVEFPGVSRQELLDSCSHLVQLLQLEHDAHNYQNGADPGDFPTPVTRGILNTAECRLLVIDDDAQLRKYMVTRLAIEGYKVDDAPGVEAAQSLLRERKYDLCTLDLMMLPRSGYELFAFIKDDPSLKWMPMIVLSALDDPNEKIRCFHLGADDYVTKPFRYEELSAKIYNMLLRTKTFEQLAFRDPLTGACNRRYFDHQIDVEIQRTFRYPAPLSIAFIDIDRFKSVNDTYGHAIGDIVLQGLAHTVQHHLRTSDLLARYGGEEFVVIFPNTPAHAAADKLESILEVLRHQPVARHEGQAYRITFSAGVAEWNPGLTKDNWIALADNAMYEAKQQGRNRVVVCGQSDTKKGGQRPPAKVLVADCDAMFRAMLVSRLQQLGYETVEATDGNEAYHLLANAHPQVCIVNSALPQLNGFGLLSRLREDAPDASLLPKMIMTWDRKLEDEIELSLKLGVNDCLVKPISMLELELRVKRLLEENAANV